MKKFVTLLREIRVPELVICTVVLYAVGLSMFKDVGCRTNILPGNLSIQGSSCKCDLGQVYPKVGKALRLGALIQSFNHKNNIKNISTSLSQSRHIDEVIICEDGSSDGSLLDWTANLNLPTQVVVRSNNLHEMRSYNRAMRVVESDIVLLLQDDDLIPMDETWLDNALNLFSQYPDLGVLSGYIGQTWDYDTKEGHEYGEYRSTHGGQRMGNTQKIPFIDKGLNIPFMFVECGWIAPLFVRRSLLTRIGGLDLNIARVGEPGVWQDCILSFDAWVHGYQVAVFDGKLERGVGGHGSASSEEKMKLRDLVWQRAFNYSWKKFNRPKIHSYVTKLNQNILSKRGVYGPAKDPQ